MAGRADQMKMPRVPVRRLEARAPLAEIDFARDVGVDHPLQRAIDRRPADARLLASDLIEQIVGADVPLLAEKHRQDAIALAGTPAAGRAQGGEIWKWSIHLVSWCVGELANEFTNSPNRQLANCAVNRLRRIVRSRRSTSPGDS